jgi:hypothetical protein
MDITFALRKFRKSIAGFTILAILASFFSFASIAMAFDDTDGHWAAGYIDTVYAEGWMTGYDEDTFGPDNSLTRAELATVAVRAFLGEDLVDADYDAGFTDLNGDWSDPYINTAEMYALVSGDTDDDGNPLGTYRPNDIVNRAEAAKVFVEAAGLTLVDGDDTFDDVDSAAWYYGYVETAYFYSIIDGYGDGDFGPGDPVKRGQIAKIAVNADEPVERDDEVETSTDGDLTIEVSDDTPEGTTVPDGATSVEIAAWDFTAESDDVMIDRITVHQYGISSIASTHSLYLYEETDRLTSGVSINTSTYEARFNNLDLEIEEGETRTFTVRMDMGTTNSNDEVALEIESVDAIDADGAEVDADFPLQCEKFVIAADDAGTVTIIDNGTITNPKVGEDDVTVAKFKLSAATEAAEVSEIGLYVTGTISVTDIENFELYVTGETDPIATADGLDANDVARFVLDTPYEITKGGSKNFTVMADFNTGRTDDTIKIYVDESTDLVALGGTYGFGMQVDRTGYDATGTGDVCDDGGDDECNYSALEGGDITISSGGPAATSVAINGADITLMDFSITAISEVTFKNFPVAFTASEAEEGAIDTEGLLNDAAANFTDIKVSNVDDGDELMTAFDSDALVTAIDGSTAISETTDAAIAYHIFTDDFTLEAGEELNLTLTADVANTTTLDGMTIFASLPLGTNASYPEIKDVNNKALTNTSVLVPASTITGKTMTVSSPSLTLSLASTPVAGASTYVKGDTNVPFTGLVFACGEASDCKITDITVTGYMDDDASSGFIVGVGPTHSTTVTQIVGSVWLEDADGNELASAKGVNSSTGEAAFTNLEWELDAGETAIAYIMGDIDVAAYADSDGEFIAFEIDTATDVTVQDDDTNSITPTGTINTAEGTYVSVSDGGSLTIAVANTPEEDIVVAGTSDAEISKFKFTTTDEAFLVKSISVNNRQSAATTNAMGDYDNNASEVTLSYTNSDGDTETANGYLVSGTAKFSGLDFYIGKDDSEYLTVYADVNTISGGSATAGEFIDLSLAFNNFEATAQGSNQTYNTAKYDNDQAAASDLDFGTVTWVDPGALDINVAVATLASLGQAQTITVDNAAAATPINLPVGTMLCVSAAITCDETADSVLIVTSWTEGSAWVDGASGDTVTTVVANNDDTEFANDDDILYALPGTGWLANTNHMHVYESKPVMAVSASSPTGTGNTTSAADEVFVFTVTNDSDQDDITVNVSVDFPTCVAGTGTSLTTATNTAISVDGTGCDVTAVDTSGDSVLYANTADLSTYSYVSFWFRWHDDDANLATLLPAELAVATADLNDGTEDQVTALAATNYAGGGSYFVEDTWYFIKDVAMPTGTAAADLFIGLQFLDADTLAAGDDVYIDQFRVYNQKFEFDVATDAADLDRTYDQSLTSAKSPVPAYLKKDGTTVATGYIDTVPVDTGGDGAEDATHGQTALVTFIPASTEITIDKESYETFTIVTDTQKLLDDDSGVDDPLTFTMNLGSSSAGTVTPGDFWWYDSNSTIRWVGNVGSSVITSTLSY